MPTAVLMMIGQTEVMKITKIAEGWLSRNAASEIGSQASGETVRSTWKIGIEPAHGPHRLADQRAERDADRSRQAVADGDALQRGQTRQHRPLSMPPRSKNGSTIRSQVSASTREGAGSVDPGLPHNACQTNSKRASTTIGGTTRAATSAKVERQAADARWPLDGQQPARVGGGFADPARHVSTLRTVMFMELSPWGS